MMYEGREVLNNGCKLHDNCLTCPREMCIFDEYEEVKATPAIEKRRARQNAYYHAHKEKWKERRLRRLKRLEEAKKNGEGNNTMQLIYES